MTVTAALIVIVTWTMKGTRTGTCIDTGIVLSFIDIDSDNDNKRDNDYDNDSDSDSDCDSDGDVAVTRW